MPAKSMPGTAPALLGHAATSVFQESQLPGHFQDRPTKKLLYMTAILAAATEAERTVVPCVALRVETRYGQKPEVSPEMQNSNPSRIHQCKHPNPQGINPVVCSFHCLLACLFAVAGTIIISEHIISLTCLHMQCSTFNSGLVSMRSPSLEGSVVVWRETSQGCFVSLDVIEDPGGASPLDSGTGGDEA